MRTDYSPLVLAWLGDAVLEFLTREKIVSGGNMPVNKMFNSAKKYSSATAQSEFYNILLPNLTEEETDILKRGRNAKSHSRSKNASVIEYRRATGVEALFGYLHLMKQEARIVELFNLWENIKEGIE